MKKILAYLFIFLFFVLFLAGLNFAQTPPESENFSDREYDQTWSCVHMEQNGQVQLEKAGRSIPKSPIKMSGVCNDSVGCEVVICALPTGGGRTEGEGRGREPCLSVGMGGAGINGERPQEDIPSYCYDKCWVNKDENISAELKQFFAGAVSAQAGPDSNINTNNVLGYMPYITFNSDSNLNSFPSGSFSNIEGVLHNVHGHAVYMVYAAPVNGVAPIITLLSPVPTEKNTANNTQQLGMITTSSTTVQISGTGDPQMCTIVLWDPYGRVFDAQSLEPLGKDEAIVTLLDKDGNKVNLPTNDDSLDVFGLYNILVVKDDNYKLKVFPKTNHLFEPVNPNPLYKDLFSEFIYMAGDPPFYEKASDPKRVDIPLKPIGTPYSRPIEIGRMTQKDVNTGTQFIIKVTHPLSIVKVISDGKVLTEDGYGKKLPGQTDKSGLWQAVIKKSLLSQYGYSIEVSKNSKYYKSGSYTRTVTPDPNRITIDDSKNIISDGVIIAGFNPLLEYIEGYAYSKDQKIISDAKVNVILKMDKSIYYQTTTDSSGFFTIYSKNLPFLDYYFEFIDPQTQIKITQSTSQFVKNNESYIKSENLDLMKSTKNNQPIVNPKTGELNEIRKEKINITPVTLNKKTINIKILTLVFIIFLLIIISVTTVFYIKKSR